MFSNCLLLIDQILGHIDLQNAVHFKSASCYKYNCKCKFSEVLAYTICLYTYSATLGIRVGNSRYDYILELYF